MRSSGHLWMIAIVVVAAFVVTTMVNVHAQTDSRPELRIRLQFARPGGLYDPGQFLFASDLFVYPSLYNWLVRWKPGTGGDQLEPDLAERWTVSPDGLTYTFYLRKGVEFHKGLGEVTARDVVFSFRRQMDDEKKTFNVQVSQIAGVEAIDKYTVRIRLKEPNASFLPAVIGYVPGVILPMTAVQQLGEEFAKNPVGTGPFIFERLLGGREVSLVANERYFRGAPEVRRITFAHIPDEVVAALALIKGEFHVIWTRGNPEAVRLLQQTAGVRTQLVVVYSSLREVTMSPQFKPTQDVRVRRALSHAINRQLIAAALPGLELPTDVMRSNKAFGGSLNVPRYPYDPEKARRLLVEAGYPSGFKVRIMYQTRSPEDILANIVQSSWQAVGIDATLEPTEPLLTVTLLKKLDFDVAVISQGRPDPDLFFSDLFSSSSRPPTGYNYFGYSNVDDLLLAARREQNRAKRQSIYEQLNRRLMTDLPIIPLSNQIFVAAWRDPVVAMVNGISNEFWSESIKVRR